MNHLTRTIATVVAAACIGTAVAPAASAASDTPDTSATSVAALVTQASSPAGLLSSTASSDTQAAIATTGAVTVAVPRAADAPIQITAATDGGDSQLVASIGLPEPTNQSATKTDNGTVVYTGTSTSVAVQPLDGAVRVATAINDADAPRSYSYPLTLPAGAQLTARADGGYDVVVGDLTTATIEAPWAKDAQGRGVPTAYHLDGADTLVQTVSPDSAAVYPIVADPLLTFGNGVYMNMTGAKLAVARMAAITLVEGGAVVTCMGLAKLPTWVSRALAFACAVGFTPSFMTVISDLKNAPKGLNPVACYQSRIIRGWSGTTGWGPVNAKNCN